MTARTGSAHRCASQLSVQSVDLCGGLAPAHRADADDWVLEEVDPCSVELIQAAQILINGLTLQDRHERALLGSVPEVFELKEIRDRPTLMLLNAQAGAGQHVGLTHPFTARQCCQDASRVRLDASCPSVD